MKTVLNSLLSAHTISTIVAQLTLPNFANLDILYEGEVYEIYIEPSEFLEVDNNDLKLHLKIGMEIYLQELEMDFLMVSKAMLTWSIAQQINNEKFIIQHSSNQQSFNPIGELEGAGTTNEIMSYDFIHKTPSYGMNYYRIKQVDFDGSYSSSDVVVSILNESNCLFFPIQGKGEFQ